MSTEQPEEPRSAPDLAAHVVSLVVSPVIVPVATAAFLLWVLGANRAETLTALAFIVFTFFLFPLADIFWMVSKGFASSLDLPDRSERTGPMIRAMIAAIIGLFIYTRFESAIDLVGILALTYVVNLLPVLIINLFWKISVHAMAVAGMLGIVLYLVGPAFGLMLPTEAWIIVLVMVLVPAVMWARVQLQMHTPGQVVAGAGLGFVGHWVGFYLITRMWLA